VVRRPRTQPGERAGAFFPGCRSGVLVGSADPGVAHEVGGSDTRYVAQTSRSGVTGETLIEDISFATVSALLAAC
jgi:hypothetical protein